MRNYSSFALVIVVIVAVSVSITGVAARAATRPVFAVFSGTFEGDKQYVQWLGTGLAFDIERRLDRWGCMSDSDRLQVNHVLQAWSGKNDQDTAHAILSELGADLAIGISGQYLDGVIRLTVRVWTAKDVCSDMISVNGNVSDTLFLENRVVDQLVDELRHLYPSLPEPNDSARIHTAIAPSMESLELITQAMVALHTGKLDAAKAFIDRSIKLEPKLWWGHYLLGAVDFNSGKYVEATQHCLDAISIDPDLYLAVYANLSYCYAQTGHLKQSEEARLEFEKRAGKSLPVDSMSGLLGLGH